MMTDLWTLENEIYDEGYTLLCGVDEAGRGPLAGPVCAAAVILPRGFKIEGLDDSKKLTEKKREALYDVILREALAYGVAESTAEQIDRTNILAASLDAMRRAVEQVKSVVIPGLVLVDGNRSTGIGFPSRCVVKGDARCADIAAASVLAKVTRDRYMLEMAEKYPEYRFELHKGYGTKLHYDMLREHGPSPIHRMSFLRKLYG